MSFFDFVVVAMYATQSSRFGVPRHAIVSPLSRNRFRPSPFARGFRLACMIAVLHQEVRVRGPKTSGGDRSVSREHSRKFCELLWITANLPFDQSVGDRAVGRLLLGGHRHKMYVVGGLIVGNPDDTPESIEANLEFA